VKIRVSLPCSAFSQMPILRKKCCLLEESHQSKQSKLAGSAFHLQILHSPPYFLLTFSPASFAIRLRSSVVSVLFSLIAEMVPTGPKILDYSTLWRSPETTARLAWRDDGIVSEALHCCLVMQIWRVLALSSLSRFRDLGEGYLETLTVTRTKSQKCKSSKWSLAYN
jgi:hypothetical protein